MLGNKDSLIKFLEEQNENTIFELKEKKQSRTLTQNAYYWALVNQIAIAIGITAEDVHKDLIFNYSVSELVVVRSEIDVSSLFKYYQFVRDAKINGQDFKIYKLYIGSSKMSKKEFSHLLDGIVQECMQLNIPTLTKEEIEKLKYIENLEE
jgi:hypothetical protein